MNKSTYASEIEDVANISSLRCKFSFAGLSKLAFTLAEVLITLGIIGVVAEMTIPTLVQNTQEKVAVTSLKKAYSVLSQAYTMSAQENGTPDTWGLTGNDATSQKIIINNFIPFLGVAENCVDKTGSTTVASITGCVTKDDYKDMSGAVYANYYDYPGGLRPKIRLKDGMTFIFEDVWSTSCSYDSGSTTILKSLCSEIIVDINGDKKPNAVGKDFFWFKLTKDGIVPHGSVGDSLYDFTNFCKNKATGGGYGCAAWVIYNENMDYLRCSDLDWATKTKCS